MDLGRKHSRGVAYKFDAPQREGTLGVLRSITLELLLPS